MEDTLRRLGAALPEGLEHFARDLRRNVHAAIGVAARKAELLRQIAAREGIDLRQVIAVGDGANDLPMLGLAGLGIAFHAKPVVKEGAGHAISNLGLDAILYLLGLRDRDVDGQ